MSKNPKVRKILSLAVTGIVGTLTLFCLGTVLITYWFPVPPTLLIFSPPPPRTLDFGEVDEIIIDDHWAGLSSFASREAHYVLNKEQGQFTGEASFSVRFFDPLHATAPLAVSGEEIKKFTDLLAQSQLERGVYIPNRPGSDDYPNIKISLMLRGREVANFASISQGEDHTPWKATINGNSYIVRSALPAKALEELKENLRQDVLSELIDQIVR